MFSRKPSDIDNDLRRHSQAVTERRQQEANDRCASQGLGPRHCGVEASMNSYGDYECVRCGEVGF